MQQQVGFIAWLRERPNTVLKKAKEKQWITFTKDEKHVW